MTKVQLPVILRIFDENQNPSDMKISIMCINILQNIKTVAGDRLTNHVYISERTNGRTDARTDRGKLICPPTLSRGNEKDKRTNNNLQNTTQKTNDQVTRPPLNIGGERRCSWSVGSSCSTSGTHLIANPMISNCCSCHCPVYMAVRFTSNVCEFDVARGKFFFIL